VTTETGESKGEGVMTKDQEEIGSLCERVWL